MAIDDELLDDVLDLLTEDWQAVTLRQVSSVTTKNADGSITPSYTDYSGYAVFGETGRRMASLAGANSPREVSGSREVAYLAAKNFLAVPKVGDVLYRASTATGTPQRVEASDATQPGATAVLYRLELAR